MSSSSKSFPGNFGKPENDPEYLATIIDDEEEVARLLKVAEKKKKNKLQIFLFSATLSVEESFKKQVKGKKTHHAGTLASLIERIDFPEPGPVIVDITRQGVLAEKISESRIFCPLEEKDSYLYYFLNRFTGRSIVFVNRFVLDSFLSSPFRVLNYVPTAWTQFDDFFLSSCCLE